jgi:hypothetical protein
MNIGIVMDFVSLTKEVVSLLKEHQIEKAAEKARSARRELAFHNTSVRQATIREINSMVYRLKDDKKKVLQAIENLPETERLYAGAQIEEILDEIYNIEIAALLARKHELSQAPR